MKLYLNDEKTHVDPCPHNGIQCGLDSNDRDHCATAGRKIQFKLRKKSSSTNSIFQTGELQKSSADRQGVLMPFTLLCRLICKNQFLDMADGMKIGSGTNEESEYIRRSCKSQGLKVCPWCYIPWLLSLCIITPCCDGE